MYVRVNLNSYMQRNVKISVYEADKGSWYKTIWLGKCIVVLRTTTIVLDRKPSWTMMCCSVSYRIKSQKISSQKWHVCFRTHCLLKTKQTRCVPDDKCRRREHSWNWSRGRAAREYENNQYGFWIASRHQTSRWDGPRRDVSHIATARYAGRE